MREIYEETNGIDWDKKIVIELSLLELQMIKDTFSVSNGSDVIKHFNYKHVGIPCPYDSNKQYDLWDELKKPLERNGGIV